MEISSEEGIPVLFTQRRFRFNPIWLKLTTYQECCVFRAEHGVGNPPFYPRTRGVSPSSFVSVMNCEDLPDVDVDTKRLKRCLCVSSRISPHLLGSELEPFFCPKTFGDRLAMSAVRLEVILAVIRH